MPQTSNSVVDAAAGASAPSLEKPNRQIVIEWGGKRYEFPNRDAALKDGFHVPEDA